jgi:hypothetical protein
MVSGDPYVVLPVKTEENTSNLYIEFHRNSGAGEARTIRSASDSFREELGAGFSLDHCGR